MRTTVLLIILTVSAASQTSALFRLGDAINLIAPATNQDGNVIAFAAAVAPDGTARKGTDLYLFDRNTIRRLTNYAGESNITGVTSVTYAAGFAGYTAIPSSPSGIEEVHVIDAAGTADRTVATDKEGCIQPLCVNCFRACVGPVHLTADASKVLYAVARQNPFWVVNADGSARKQLPVYTGALAASPQRVISRDGQIVFTSSAPFGPTFAAAATDVSIVNLDGNGLRQVTRFGSANFFATNATISADGSLIAFESNYSESGPQQVNQIWVVKPDGTELRAITNGPNPASSPSISADGKLVAYLQNGQINLRAVASQRSLVLTTLSSSIPQSPVLSDDGSRIVFTLGPQSGGPAAVYRIPSDAESNMRAFTPIYVPRFVNANGVASAAGYGAPSPGSLISVYGANLGVDELAQATAFPLPLTLNGVSLTVNGKPVPLIAATPWQINAQLPQTAVVGTAAFQVNSLAPVSSEIKNTSPAILAFPFIQGRLYYSQAAAFHAGTGIPADMDHPAAAGEVLEIYGMGLGLTDPMAEAGMPSPASPPARALRMPRVQIANRDVTVVFAGLTPGLAGIYQVNAMVPSGLAPGLHTVTWAGPEGAVITASIAVK